MWVPTQEMRLSTHHTNFNSKSNIRTRKNISYPKLCSGQATVRWPLSYALRGLFGHICIRKGWRSGGDNHLFIITYSFGAQICRYYMQFWCNNFGSCFLTLGITQCKALIISYLLYLSDSLKLNSKLVYSLLTHTHILSPQGSIFAWLDHNQKCLSLKKNDKNKWAMDGEIGSRVRLCLSMLKLYENFCPLVKNCVLSCYAIMKNFDLSLMKCTFLMFTRLWWIHCRFCHGGCASACSHRLQHGSAQDLHEQLIMIMSGFHLPCSLGIDLCQIRKQT